MSKFKVAFGTLGCKVNQYETEAIKELFLKHETGIFSLAGEDSGDADVFIINTCTVTNLSDRKSRQMIRRAIKENPGAVVCVMGCYSQTSPEEVGAIEGVDIIAGTKDRKVVLEKVLEKLLEKMLGRTHEEDIVKAENDGVLNNDYEWKFEKLEISNSDEKTRAFVKIQDGCENFCAYCKIPIARGPIRSRPLNDVLDEVARLENAGYKEIVLTGIHLASYGKDLGEGQDLITVIKALGEMDGEVASERSDASGASGAERIARIRLGSVEPTTLTASFIEAVASQPKCCTHFHVSLQSGCDRTLARMLRKYSSAQYLDSILRLRARLPEVSVTTDIIVGFPGETDADFEESYEFVKRIGFANVHVFKFSPRKGTLAAGMADQISAEIKETRSQKMIALAKEMSIQFNQKMVARSWTVLVEQPDNAKMLEGHSSNYVKFYFPVPEGSAHEVSSATKRLAYRHISGDGFKGKLVEVFAESANEMGIFGTLKGEF